MLDATSTPGNRLVSRAEIASIVGVRRPAVTNWARRHLDFPKPVRSGDIEYFSLPEILSWLGRRRVPARLRTNGEPPDITYGDRARHNLRAAQETLPEPVSMRQGQEQSQALQPGDSQRVAELMGPLADKVRGDGSILDYLSLLLSLSFLQSNDRTRQVLRQDRAGLTPNPEGARTLLQHIGEQADAALRRRGVLPGMGAALARLSPRTYGDLLRAVRLTERLGPGAFRLILDEYEARADLRSSEFFTPRGVAALVARLAIAEGEVSGVFDPYLRGGELLAAAAEHAGDQGGVPPVVRGESLWQDTLRFAAMNLTLQGVRPHLGKVASVPWESAELHGQKYSYVLSNPPFNMSDSTGQGREEGLWLYGAPPRSNDNFAWLQYALSSLAPGGRAAVIMPNKAGNSANKAECAIRKAMVEAGAVECIVALPPNLFSKAQVPVSIWLLTRPEGGLCREILFVDASLCGTRRGGRRILEPRGREAIAEAVMAWRAGRRPNAEQSLSEAYAAVVPLGDVREANYSLNPIDYTADQRRVSPNAPDAAALSASVQRTEELREHAQAADRSVGTWDIRAARTHGQQPVALLESICEIKAGPSYTRLPAAERSEDGAVPVILPRHLRGGSITEDLSQRISPTLAHALHSFRLDPGDILCVRSGAMGAPALVLPEHSGWLFSTNLLRVRIRPGARVDSEYLLHYLSLPHVLAWVKDRAAATAAPSLRAGSLGQLRVPLPELGEQQGIAAALKSLKEQACAYEQLAKELAQSRTALAIGLFEGTLHIS